MGKGPITGLLFAVCAWFSLASAIAYGSESITLEKANQAYREGKLEEARANYLQLISSGVVAPELFFNLGNVWLKEGEQGRAILNFRRSLVLNPNFTAAQQNLDSVRRSVGNVEEHSLYTWLALRSDFWLALTTIFFWLTAIAVLLGIVSQRFRPASKFVLVFIGPVLVLSLAATLWVGDGMKDPNLAVVVDQSADVRYGPAASARTVVTMGAGQELRLIEERGNWTLCRLSSGLSGWIPSQSVERIIPR
jgi:tetratricopeptide (TPR) repeat protein